MCNRILIQNVRLVGEKGVSNSGYDILIQGDRIADILPPNAPKPKEIDKIVEGNGKLCFPGVVDDQVHFRDPGLTHKGDIASESAAALLGGVTSWMDMPNTLPQTTTIEAWEEKMKLGAEKACGNFAFYFGGTNENAELLPQIDVSHIPGVKVFMGASTGNMLVDTDDALRRIFSLSPILVALHSESEPIIQANKAKYQVEIGPDPDVKYHPLIRSREACIESTKRAIRLAEETGAKIHILHLSTKEEAEYLGSGDYPFATSEVCVHHLWFESSDYEKLGTRIKWNPAIKESYDRQALRAGLKAGRLDIVATDHAPHLLKEKEGGSFKAASGGPLVQFSLLMMLELVREDIFTYEEVANLMCTKPCKLFGIKERGSLEVGKYADILLVDPNNTLTVTPDIIRSTCGWSPLEGVTFSHTVTDVFLNGVHVVINGIIDEAKANRVAMPLLFTHEK